MAHSQPTFGERFAYARFVHHLMTGEPVGNAEIARAVGRTGPAITTWMARDSAPPFYDVRKPLASFLGVPEAWLFDGEGEPPRADLWKDWIAQRRAQPTYMRVAEHVELATYDPKGSRKPAKRARRKKGR